MTVQEVSACLSAQPDTFCRLLQQITIKTAFLFGLTECMLMQAV